MRCYAPAEDDASYEAHKYAFETKEAAQTLIASQSVRARQSHALELPDWLRRVWPRVPARARVALVTGDCDWGVPRGLWRGHPRLALFRRRAAERAAKKPQKKQKQQQRGGGGGGANANKRAEDRVDRY